MTATPSIELRWQPGQRHVRWTYGSVEVELAFPSPPATVTVWPDPPSVVVVEDHTRIDNAAVYEPDGAERLRLCPPAVSAERQWDIGFYAVYAEPSGLVAVFSTQVGDFWGRPDLHTGELNHVAPWR
ncbi:hypothetical protein [Asanoa iriomotensis]|uniref:Uncharacterized protein n=1 Tax=Asanoa iriomotensis TaxID=234613 RepID=A0ABQ4BTX3_9ACTN|nr:hypothetical protein [Asanoa iriomotensis]GIF53970.1 hypothetical protein Air01nite_00650 [Asanoa iriomotensis]